MLDDELRLYEKVIELSEDSAMLRGEKERLEALLYAVRTVLEDADTFSSLETARAALRVLRGEDDGGE